MARSLTDIRNEVEERFGGFGKKSGQSQSRGLSDIRDSVNRYLTNREDPNAVIDGEYINQYLQDHQAYWSKYGAGKADYENPYYRLDERRTAIDEWLGSSLADGTIDQEYYDQVTGILGDIDSYVGMYQGQRDAGAYMNDWREWFNQSADALDGMDWSTGRAGGAFVDEAIAGFAERDAATRAWLEENRERLGDDYYSSMMAELDSYSGYADELRTAYDQNAAHFSRWDNQEDYDRYSHLSGMDLGAAEADIADMRKAYDDLDEIKRYQTAGYATVPEAERDALRAYHEQRYAEIVEEYGTDSTIDLWDRMTRMQEDVEEAGSIQEDMAWADQIRDWEEQYGGMSYSYLTAAIDRATDPAEKVWLEQQAPKAMTDADYAAELERVNSEIAYLEDLLEKSADPLDNFADEIYASGYSGGKDINDRLEVLRQERWQLENDRKYSNLSGRDDFAENSKVTASEMTSGFGMGIGSNTWIGKGDAIYDYINFLDGSPEAHKARNESEGRSSYSIYDKMTDEERQRYNYLYNTEGRKSANEYLRYLKPELDKRVSMAASQQMAELADAHPLVADALNVPLTLTSGLGYADLVAQKIGRTITGSDRPINYYSPAMNLAHESRAISQTRVRNITDKYGVINIDPEDNPFWAKVLNGRGMADVYQLGISAINSKVAAMTGNPVLATALLASSAATQGVLDALDRGATDDQALQMGLWNGVFEAVFEFIEVENLLKGNPSRIKAVVNQAITEGLGEGFTSIANNIADVMIMADKSEIMEKAAEYQAQGMSQNRAMWNAIADAAVSVGWDIVGGAASGAVSVGGMTVTDAISRKVQYNRLPVEVKTSVDRLQNYGNDRDTALRISALLYEQGEEYGDSTGAYMAAYDPKQDAYAYAADFRKAYEIGRNNGNREYLGKLSLNEAQQKIAYELGAAESRKASREAKAPEMSEEERTYSVSDDGATIDSSGKKVTIKGFSSVGGKVTLELEGGKTIDAKEVSFGTADEAILYETIGQVAGSASTANRILKSYETAAKEGMSASDFAAGLRQAYDLGVSGQVAERQLGTYELAGKLPVAARGSAFSRGRAVGQYNATARQAALKARGRQVQGKREGTFHFDRRGRTFDRRRESALKAMEALSKALGVDIYVYESYKEGGKRVYQDRSGKTQKAPNGYYDAQGIHIDLNAGNFGQGTMMFTVAHELTHFAKEWSPVKYRKLADLLVERYAEQGTSVRDLIDKQIVKAKENGREIDRDTAFEEVVADSMEAMLTQGDIGRFMAELKQQDRSLWEKVRDWFKDLIQKLQAVVEQYKGAKPETAEGQLVAQMEDFIQVLQQAYAEALVEAGENYRASEGNKKTTQEGGVKFQTRNVNGKQIVWIEENILKQNKGLPEHQFIADYIAGHIGDIYTIIESGQKVYIGDDLPGEFTQSKYTQSILKYRSNIIRVKNRSAGNVGEMIEIATNRRWEKAKHPENKDAKYGMYRYDTMFGFPVRDSNGNEIGANIYKAELVIRNASDGKKYLYDIVSIKKDATASGWLTNKVASAAAIAAGQKGNASSKRLPQQKPGVNPKSTEKQSARMDVEQKKFSDRDAGAEKVVQELEKQNAKLKEDVKDLRKLLRLQGKVTHGQEFRKSSIDAAVKGLAKEAMATLDAEDRKQLHEMLKDFYKFIATDKELAWEGVMEKAGRIADFLQERVNIKPQRDGYADEVLRQIRGTKVRLSDSQRAEVEKLYGYETYRRMLFGAGVYLSKDGMALDSFWHELNTDLPGTFADDVNEGDQPAELLRIIEAMREGDDSMAMEYAYNHEAIRQGLIRAVYDSYWRVDNLKTVADRKQKEINEIRRKHTERMEAMKEEQRQTVRDLKDKRRADIAAVRKEYQEKNRKQIDAMRERYKENRARTNEIRSAAHQRKAVEKAAKDLMDMLSRPTKEAHVPMALQAPLEKFLNSIDFSSKRALAGGELTIKDVAYTRALQEVKTAIAQQRTALEGAADGTFSLDVPKDFLDRIEDHINLINKATEGLDLTTNRVYEMTSDELKDLTFILKTINKAIRDIDKLHMAGAKARVSELSRSTVWEMGRRKAVKTEDGGRFMWRNYTPTFAFERMGAAATQVLNGLKMGQAKLARTAASVIRFSQETYTNKEVKAWENEIHEVKLDSGETVKMTTAQVMSFYCLSRREQAKGHLNGGGIRMSNIGEGRKMIRQTEHFRLTQEDIARINGLLTDRQREVANKLQRYMADVGGRLGNEISMARWDYMEMTDRDYFPIRSDSDIHDARNPDQDKTNLWALLNKSFTKQVTPGANDAMIVSSVFDVFADHMSDMAEYNAFALPLVDAMKWYNYRETEKQENGQIKTIGVKKAINDKLGTAAGEYFIDLMTDINSSQKAGRYEDFFGKLLSRSKAASVGWNLRVAIQQPTAILRASVYLDPKSLVKGTARLGMKKSAEEMKKYSGIALWKSLGYYDLNISRGIRDQIKGDTTLLDKINDAGMWLPGKVDEQTWARIWESCKEQVRRQQKLSGERLLEETAKLFEDVVYHTQVADSVLTRSGLMRSKSQTMKEWTSFMAEPTLSVNLLMNAFQDYREGVSRGEKAKRTMKILFCGYVLSAIANAVVTAFADAARDDDEYEGYWDKFFQALLGEKFYDGNLFAELNPLEKIVFVRDVLSLLRGYEGAKNPFVELAENGIKLVQNIVKFFQGKGSLTSYGLIYQSLQVLGGFTGAAPANLLREATTLWNWTFGKWNNMPIHRYKTDPKDSIRNAYDSGTMTKSEARDALVDAGESVTDAYWILKGWDAGENIGMYDDVYKAALAGEDIGAAVDELVEHGEKTEKEVLSQLRKQIKKWYTDSESDTRITREQAQDMVDRYLDMDPEEAAAMVEEWAFELENGYSYDDIKFTYMDNEITAEEAKSVLIERLGKTEKEADRRIQYWDYLRNNRDSELTEHQVADFYEYAEPVGISTSVYEEYIKGTKGIEGEGTKARKMAVIDSLPLSKKQKDALYFAEGWAKSTIDEAPWH